MMTTHKAFEFLNELFTQLFDSNNDIKTIAPKYMSPDYIQIVDGKTLNFDEFIDHMEVLHKVIKTVNFTFKDVITKEGSIAGIHLVDIEKKDGKKTRYKVIAFYYFNDDGKINKIDELTILLAGEHHDKDLGSRLSGSSR